MSPNILIRKDKDIGLFMHRQKRLYDNTGKWLATSQGDRDLGRNKLFINLLMNLQVPK